jgi:RNA polymerase sigma-70 factor (ECF subfamily)
MFQEEKIRDLYKKHSRELYIYLYRLTGSRETSEDLLHDVFINLINYSAKKEIEESSVRALLYKIAHNLCVNQIKRSSKLKIVNIENVTESAVRGSIDDNIITDEINAEINSILKNVDPETKSIFIMRKELGLSATEIAENTGVSERTVRRKLEAVLKLLADGLKRSGILVFLFFILSAAASAIVLFYKGLII